MPRPSHSSRFYHRTILGEEYRSLSSSLCSFLHLLFRDQVLHPYKVYCVCSLFHFFTVLKTVAVLLVCASFQYLISVTAMLAAYTIITFFKL
jgi:hypothetical protein